MFHFGQWKQTISYNTRVICLDWMILALTWSWMQQSKEAITLSKGRGVTGSLCLQEEHKRWDISSTSQATSQKTVTLHELLLQCADHRQWAKPRLRTQKNPNLPCCLLGLCSSFISQRFLSPQGRSRLYLPLSIQFFRLEGVRGKKPNQTNWYPPVFCSTQHSLGTIRIPSKIQPIAQSVHTSFLSWHMVRGRPAPTSFYLCRKQQQLIDQRGNFLQV